MNHKILFSVCVGANIVTWTTKYHSVCVCANLLSCLCNLTDSCICTLQASFFPPDLNTSLTRESVYSLPMIDKLSLRPKQRVLEALKPLPIHFWWQIWTTRFQGVLLTKWWRISLACIFHPCILQVLIYVHMFLLLQCHERDEYSLLQSRVAVIRKIQVSR